MNIYVIVLIIFVLLGIFLIFKFTKSYKISGEKISFFEKNLRKIIANGSYKEQIIDIDKLYHKVLQESGYNGTFGEILKQEPSEISNLNKVWELHKLRNKLVHEFDLLSERKLKEKSDEYQKEVKSLIKQFK